MTPSRTNSTASSPSRTFTRPTTALEAGEETDSAYRIAGRLAGRRGHGGAAFLDVIDRSGKLQVHAKRDVLGEEAFDTLTRSIWAI